MSDIAERSLGELVSNNHRIAEILEDFNLDFCCGGKKSLKEACTESEVELQEIVEKLREMPESHCGMLDADFFDADQLGDYIEKKHHSYVNQNIPVVLAYIQKVYSVHGRKHPELATVLSLFGQISHKMMAHMEKEETLLFPLIRELADMHRKGYSFDQRPGMQALDYPLKEMIDEHEDVGNMMAQIAMIANGYRPPAGACNTYKVMLAKLQEFERDLHVHFHLENNVLFPKAAEIEQEILDFGSDIF